MPSTDQRGFSRDGATDIGAFEYNGGNPVTTYTLTYTAGANGSITGTSPQIVSAGADGSAVTAVPATGYSFTSWSDASTQNPRTDTAVSGNVTVSASFAINTYTLTYTAGANGSITGTSPQTVNYGADGSAVTAVPATGYSFTSWSDASTQNPRTDTGVVANISVTASFADSANPVISGVNATVNNNSVTIEWTTDESSSSLVEYGTTNSYGTSTSEADTSPRVTTHSVQISDLSRCTTYYFRVKSTDATSNQGVGSENTFRTGNCGSGRPPAVPPSLPPTANIIAQNQVNNLQNREIGNSQQSNNQNQVASSTTIEKFVFKRDLKPSQQNLDIKQLQTFLSSHLDTYPEKIISGNYGPMTKSAVIRFQEKYASEILTPLGLTKGTGIVGPYTRKKLNELIANSDNTLSGLGSSIVSNN